ncbi:MAG: ATP phosphoribosyltransferase regulatory subunit [Gammaproteobacteria bacterium]|nr:MAG: ATP phosphoribosyltransferase regulatory subunit [Gammaproteobacteria bacterium]
MSDASLNPTATDRWMLPEGIEEVLPPGAWQLESLRRRLLDVYQRWGYQLIVPPLAEFLDSLLTGVGHDLDLKTFKLTDQLSGKMMGIRADMTPQAARIDARQPGNGIRRYCYIGSTLLTRPKGVNGSRAPVQVGCELFGSDALAADAEVVCLMLHSLEACGVPATHLELGHMGVYRALLARTGISEAETVALFEALKRRSIPDVDHLSASLPENERELIRALPRLSGGLDVIGKARALLDHADLTAALDALEQVAQCVQKDFPDVDIHIDLGELRGYTYHTGLTFSAYRSGMGSALAHGGRYDGVGASFGRPRPATGFSLDLRALLPLIQAQATPPLAVLAPAEGGEALEAAIRELRRTRPVIRRMPGDALEDYSDSCDAMLTCKDGVWRPEPFSNRS